MCISFQIHHTSIYMADLYNQALYGCNYEQISNGGLGIQYHITAKCDQKCKHCYLINSDNYEKQIDDEMSYETIIALIDEIYNFINKYNVSASLAITGGDPILSSSFFDILEYIQKYSHKINVNIIGNPYHIDSIVAKKLKNLNVNQYQVSLDGLEKTHDLFRRQGSFKDTIQALKVLHDNGIVANVMYTVSKQNYKEVIPLIKYLEELNIVDNFAFDRMIPIGNSKSNELELIPIDEYKRLLYDVYKYEVLNKVKMGIYKKDNLWKPLLNDLGLTDPFNNLNGKVLTGCSASLRTVSILSDGTIYACRRLEIPIGKYPDRAFEDIYVNNQFQKQYLNYNFNKASSCFSCKLNSFCRGCLAMKNAVTESIYGKDPNCWRVS